MNKHSDTVFQNLKETPYWWDESPLADGDDRGVPQRCDIAIVGSGFTGLSAALTLARAGKDVAIIEEGAIGQGASTRNFGMLGRQLKHDFSTLIRDVGLARAKALYGGCDQAFEFVNRLIVSETIDCRHTVSGRFVAANTPVLYDQLERELTARAEHLGHEFRMIPKDVQYKELGANQFCGGAVIPEHRTVDPAMFHHGLSDRVRSAGARFHARCTVLHARRHQADWEIDTSRGSIVADHLLVATNGYSGSALPWFKRRIVPINAYMIATEPLPADVLSSILPNRRGFHDSAHDMVYARIAPDGSRLLFGGLTGYEFPTLKVAALKLRQRMTSLFPVLSRSRLSHVWTGHCGGTFDFYPHEGEAAGMHYAMGYCFGAGLPFGTWLGNQVAERILGHGGHTVFGTSEMPTNALYWGKPWFMPVYLAYRRWLDWRAGAMV